MSPRKSSPKTSTERSQKSREISTLKRDMALIEEILERPRLTRLMRYFLESAFRKKFNRLQRLCGPKVRATEEHKFSPYISQADRTVRIDHIRDNDALISMGFVSGSAGVLVGAGEVPNTDIRLRTPVWLCNPDLLRVFRTKLWEHRPKTAEKDLQSLVAYYLFRQSDKVIRNKYYAGHDPDDQYHRGQIRLDPSGGCTNFQTSRRRLVQLGYQWLGIPIPVAEDWIKYRNQLRQATEDQKARRQLRAPVENPVAYEKGEVSGQAERDFGQIHQVEALALDREGEQRTAESINTRTRDRHREKARQTLPANMIEQDRWMTRAYDLIKADRIKDLHTLLAPSSPDACENVLKVQRQDMGRAA